jgi:hypothetical protein
MVKTATHGAHRGADHHDHWANLKDLFININPLKVVIATSYICIGGSIHRVRDRILQRTATSTSTTRLDFTSRCNVDAPRPPTSTTRFNFGLCRNVRTQQTSSTT